MQPRLTDDELIRLVRWEQLSDYAISKRYQIDPRRVKRMRGKLGLRSGYNPGKSVPIVIFPDFIKGWLTGLIEGDGSIVIYHFKNPPSLQPQIIITNTNKELIEKVRSVLGAFYKVGLTIGRVPETNRKIYRIFVRSRGGVISILKNTLPHLIAKREVGEKVLEFCDSRIKTLRAAGSNHAPYTEKEWELYWEVKELNKRGRGQWQDV